jgi:hypothetical protein
MTGCRKCVREVRRDIPEPMGPAWDRHPRAGRALLQPLPRCVAGRVARTFSGGVR